MRGADVYRNNIELIAVVNNLTRKSTAENPFLEIDEDCACP